MPSMKNESKEIIVIGSGFGGLSAAIRLASAGHQVTIYEKRDKIGGRAYQYEVNGFKFDGGTNGDHSALYVRRIIRSGRT
jgi:phytoene dehydrogenase-like protein